MAAAEQAKETPFYAKHVAAGAKIAPFAGYLMPIQYSGIIEEHKKVRESVGVFDVSHMGEFKVSGPDAEAYLNRLTVNDVSRLEVGQVQYSAMCYPDGGIVDDLLVYRFADHFMMVVNASNIDKDFAWAEENRLANMQLENQSDEIGLLAIQGPQAFDTLQKLTEVRLDDIPFYHFTEGQLAGIEMIISRTGYTGEKGFELYHDPQHSLRLWETIFEAVAEFDIQPVGLGARDTLRMEMKYCLYGNDIDQTTHPLEAGLGWITKLKKGEFISSDVLRKVKEEGIQRKLVAFRMLERGIPRHEYPILVDGKVVGKVTSGTQSPSLGVGIGLGYVEKPFSKIGSEIQLDVRGRKLRAEIIKPPFVPSHTL